MEEGNSRCWYAGMGRAEAGRPGDSNNDLHELWVFSDVISLRGDECISLHVSFFSTVALSRFLLQGKDFPIMKRKPQTCEQALGD